MTNYDHFKPCSDPKAQAKIFMEWAFYYFGDKNYPKHYRLRVKSPQMHYEMVELVSHNYMYSLITAPRGYAKTTLIAILWSIYRCVYRLEAFIVIIGKNDKAGKSNLRAVRNSLATNEKLVRDYGNLVPNTTKSSNTQSKKSDSDHEVTLTNGIVLRSIGMLGSVRGDVEVYRPTLIIVEDPQALKHMLEVSTLEKHQEFFDGDVIYALDPMFGKLILIGNNLGVGSLINNALKDTRFISKEFDIYDNNGRSVWEEYYPTKKLKAEEAKMRELGKGHVFDRERRNIPDDSLQKRITGYKFHNDTLVRYNDGNYIISDLYPHPIHIKLIAAIDPAFSDSQSADRRAKVILGIGKIPIDQQYWTAIWIFDYFYDHSDPSKVPDWIMNYHRQYLFDDVVIEANGGQLIYKYLIDNKMREDQFYKKHPFNMHYERYIQQSKGDRIWNRISLLCQYGQFFLKKNHTELIEECNNFGYHIRNRGIHLLDAIVMADKNVSAPNASPSININNAIPERLREKPKPSVIDKFWRRMIL